ncbi:MAG: hypothetical protein HY815_07075 [Candidatus Riflebacteria bacterium]|nr:hypothetical protein [Candidatus Riflebacteria bacterium]
MDKASWISRIGRIALLSMVVLATGAVAQPMVGDTHAFAHRLVQGTPVPTGDSFYPDLIPIAGTPLVMRLQPGIDNAKRPGVPANVVVEGPSALSKDALMKQPGRLAHAANRAYIWTKWQLASSRADKWRLTGPATHFKYPLLVPEDLLKLLKTQGPDGRPLLLPGDMIINGIGGIATHLSLYVGPDAATGEPRIVHALATPGTQQSYVQLAGNVVKSIVRPCETIGVVEEGLGGFIARYQRDTFFVLRDPRMTDPMRANGIRHVRSLVGRGYDYDMNQTNDSYYCTEIGVEMIRAAYEGAGLPVPWLGTTAVCKRTLKDFPVTPDNLLATPDLVVMQANATGWKHLDHVIRTHVVGERPQPSE